MKGDFVAHAHAPAQDIGGAVLLPCGGQDAVAALHWMGGPFEPRFRDDLTKLPRPDTQGRSPELTACKGA
jgi:hypothetical protein